MTLLRGRSAGAVGRLIVDDLRANQGRRLRHGVAWRLRRVRNRVVRWIRRTPIGPAVRVYSVGFGPAGNRVLNVIDDRATRAGLPMMTGASIRATARVIHIGEERLGDMAGIVLDLPDDIEIIVRARGRNGWRRPLSEAVAEEFVERGKSFDLLVVERRLESSDAVHVQCSRIEVAVWNRLEGPYGKSYRESDRTFELVGRLRDSTFESFGAVRHDFDDDYPAPGAPESPIDIVYTWVDGDDEAWQAEKQRYSGTGQRPSRVVHDERFRNRDELKYSLRSIHLFAPWVRRIHIVTADQCPDWLNTDHPKINLVSHRDIYRDGSWLPTFNSSGIETQLHHIPGLAKKFIYFNDDFFLGQLTDEIDFFYPNGALKYFESDQRAYEPDIDSRSEEYIQADRNAIELMKPLFRYTGRSIMRHVPYPSDRDLLAEIEEKFEAQFAACASSRFRSSDDLRPIAFMQYHYGEHTGRAMKAGISHRYLALWKEAIFEQLDNVQSSRSYKTFCINDVGLQAERLSEVNNAVLDFLEAYYPLPSPFERA